MQGYQRTGFSCPGLRTLPAQFPALLGNRVFLRFRAVSPRLPLIALHLLLQLVLKAPTKRARPTQLALPAPTAKPQLQLRAPLLANASAHVSFAGACACFAILYIALPILVRS